MNNNSNSKVRGIGKKYLNVFVVFLTIIFSISFISAELGIKDSDKPKLEAPTSNIVLNINETQFNVNNSDYLDGYDSSAFMFTDGNNSNVNAFQFNTAYTGTPAEGKLFWNTDDGTLNIGMSGGDINLQVGQEMLIRVKNDEGTDIKNGQVVYITGAVGQRPKVKLAQANDTNASHSVLGVLTEDITNNQLGYINTFGYVRDINTNSWNEGDTLYLSPTQRGNLTNVEPLNPNHAVKIGYVVNKNANNGSIFVHIDTGVDIDEVHGYNQSALNVNNSDYLDGYDSSAFWRINATQTDSSGTKTLLSSSLLQTTNNVNRYVGLLGGKILFWNTYQNDYGFGLYNYANNVIKLDGNSYPYQDDGIIPYFLFGDNNDKFNVNISNDLNVAGQIKGNGSLLTGVCLSNGTNCVATSSGGMNYTNLALTNQSNTFNFLQTFYNIIGYNTTTLTTTELFNGTQLPDNQATTPFNMTGNVILLHLNNGTGENSTRYKDFSGMNNNASCGSTGCPVFKAGEYIGNSTTFNGSVTLSITNKSEMATQTITLSAWFRTTSTTAGQSIISKAYNGPVWSSPYLTWMLRLSPASGIEYQVGGAGGSYSSSSTWLGTTNTNQWYHVAMTYNGSMIRLYRDGVNLANSSYTTGIGYTNTPVLIGSTFGASPYGNYFIGDIDEVAIFNRTLSATEITSMYNLQKSSFNTSTSFSSVTRINMTDTILAGADLSLAKNVNASEVKGRMTNMSVLGTGTPSSSNFLRGDGTWQSCLPATGYEGFIVQDSTYTDIGEIDAYGRFIPYYYYTP